MAKNKRKSKKRKAEDDPGVLSDGSENEKLDVEYLTTDPDSPFVNMDLISEFRNPEFQALLTDQDKIELAELLPDHIGLTNEGFFNEEFIRYDNDFRNGVRMYQQDLAAGRYDPEWLRQAAEAMERRAAGDFDKWKEEEFEEFWGQKQKLDPKARAGQSGTIKLNRLVEAGLFRQGDIFSYNRTFGRGKNKLTVEKDVKIVEIDGTTLTFAIPPGQLKFARLLAPPEDESVGEKVLDKKEHSEANIPTAEGHQVKTDTADEEVESKEEIHAKSINDGHSHNHEAKPAIAHNAEDDDLGEKDTEELKPTDDQVTSGFTKHFPAHDHVISTVDALHAALSPGSSSELSEIPPDVEDVILASITTLQALEDKIITVDGRLGKKVDGNAFKNIRVIRDNQDIGSLFEIREEWYVYKKT